MRLLVNWNRTRKAVSFLGALGVLLLQIGCSRSNQGAATKVTPEEAPATIESAFRDAAPEVKQQASEAATAVEAQNDAAAFARLENLSGRPDLTPEQRKAAFDSWMAVNARLQESAAKGNSAAQELLEKYKASK